MFWYKHSEDRLRFLPWNNDVSQWASEGEAVKYDVRSLLLFASQEKKKRKTGVPWNLVLLENYSWLHQKISVFESRSSSAFRKGKVFILKKVQPHILLHPDTYI